MITGKRIRVIAFWFLLAGLMCLGTGCYVNVMLPPSDDSGDTQVDGSDSSDSDGSTATDDGGSGTADDGTTDTGGGADTDPGDDEGNPNSPCPDQTNIYVSYVNESAARVVFVENFRDADNQVVSGSILALQATGDADSTLAKCITCPAQAGIRNIRYVLDGVTTYVDYPSDLFLGSFSCGDQITFVFKDGGSVESFAETP
jgi:hypothetical protein